MGRTVAVPRGVDKWWAVCMLIPMTKASETISVKFPRALRKELAAAAGKEERTQADVVRRAVRAYVTKVNGRKS
jgi:hypothetical protein